MPNHTIAEILKSVLGDVPEAAFFSGIAGLGGSPNQRRFREASFNPIFNAFQGELGQQAERGQVPDLNFVDFLDNFIAGGGFQRRFADQPRAVTGRQENFFNPRTRFQFRF